MISHDELRTIMDEEMKRMFGDPLPAPKQLRRDYASALVTTSAFAKAVLERVPAPMPFLEHDLLLDPPQHWSPK